MSSNYDPVKAAEVMARATRLALSLKGVLPNPQKWWAHSPSPKQKSLLDADYEEVFYGGAAGGGKSSFLLMAASKYVDYGNYRALILRRTINALKEPDGIIDQSQLFFAGTGARYNIQDMTWTFPSGAIIRFGYLELESHLQRYQGGGYHFIGFDELSHFPKKFYDYLFSRVRKTSRSREIPLRVYTTSNPDPKAMWIYSHFIAGSTKVGEHTHFKRHTSSEGVQWDTVFVPALLSDNPGIDKETYIKSLARLDPVERARLLRGDWHIQAKGDIYNIREPYHVITKSDFAKVYGTREIPVHWRKGLGTDWGATDHSRTGSIWVARPPAYSPYPRCKFIYRELTMKSPLIDEYYNKVIELESGGSDGLAMDFRIMSHDQLTVRRELEQRYKMHHQQAIHKVKEGIAVIQNELRLVETDKLNPFKPYTDLKGYPLLMLVVEDEEGETYENPDVTNPEHRWVVTPPSTPAGLRDTRVSMAGYRWKEDKDEPEHDQLGILDALRMIGWRFFPVNAQKTKEEKEDESLPEEYRMANIMKAVDFAAQVKLYSDRQIVLGMQQFIKQQTQQHSRTNERVWQYNPMIINK